MNNIVSVIIPLYNVENYVEISLNSAFNQTVDNIEYILVDDCSTDRTMEVVSKLVKESSCSSRVRIVCHENNRGLSAARNTGMKYAGGDYIFFMDSDDEITPDCIEKHYEALRESDVDFTIANTRLEGAKSIHMKPISDKVKVLPVITSYLKRVWSASACNKLYRKDFLEENELIFQEGLLHEDILWSYKVASKAQKAALVVEATYIYKVRANSITTHKNNSRKIESLLFILRTIYADWEGGNISAEYRKDYFRFIDFWRLNTALLLLNYNGSYKERNNYYSQIAKIVKENEINLHSCMLKLPYCIFFLLAKPAYSLYKKI